VATLRSDCANARHGEDEHERMFAAPLDPRLGYQYSKRAFS
jgi:hypothetical protein